MPWQAVASVGSSILGGVLAGGSKKQTQESTSTTKQILTDEQKAIMSQFSSLLGNRLSDPSAGTAPIRTAARNSINNNYSGAVDAIRTKMLSAGQGASGKFGRAMMGSELSRLGDLSDYENTFSKYLLDRSDSTLSLAQQFLGQQFETQTKGTGTSTIQGNRLSNGLGSGLQTAAMLFGINSMLSGGSDSSGQPSASDLAGLVHF